VLQDTPGSGSLALAVTCTPFGPLGSRTVPGTLARALHHTIHTRTCSLGAARGRVLFSILDEGVADEVVTGARSGRHTRFRTHVQHHGIGTHTAGLAFGVVVVTALGRCRTHTRQAALVGALGENRASNNSASVIGGVGG